MSPQRLWQTLALGLKSVMAHKLRSALTILGVVFGVGSVIVMMAVGEGARVEAIRQIEELGSTNILVRSIKPTADSANDTGGGIRYGLTAADLDRIVSTIPTVVSAVPVREHHKQIWHLDRSVKGRVVGVTPQYQSLNTLVLQRGRFISRLDLQRSAAVAVLAAGTAQALFPTKDPIGRTVRVGEDRYLSVIGVMEPGVRSSNRRGSVRSQDYSQDLYIPFTTDAARFGEVVSFDPARTHQREIVEISQITVAVDDTAHVKETAGIIANTIAENHPAQDTVMTVPLELLEKAERAQRMFTMVLAAIASISLIVGGIGIMNIMLATITERTREIGIRRAIGATRGDISRQFVIETVVLSGTGGVVGLIVGITLAYILGHFFTLSTIVRPWSPVLAFAISVAVGLVFGAYPARRAASMDPIKALRHE